MLSAKFIDILTHVDETFGPGISRLAFIFHIIFLNFGLFIIFEHSNRRLTATCPSLLNLDEDMKVQFTHLENKHSQA